MILTLFTLFGGLKTTTTNLSPEFIKAREDFAAWYDSKPQEIQELIDEISDRTYFIIDEDEYDEFIEELDSLNITNASTFEDAFYAEIEYTGDSVTASFAEDLVDQGGYLMGSDMPDFIKNHIDYQSVWDCELRFDFIQLEFNGNTYFFHNNY